MQNALKIGPFDCYKSKNIVIITIFSQPQKSKAFIGNQNL